MLDRRLVFVTGKGGVGKSTVAAALAALAAREGKRTLLCEIDDRGDQAAFLGTSRIRYEPRQVSPGLFVMAMNTEQSLREYLRVFLRIPVVGRIGLLASTFDFVATAAPGVREILTVGKLAYEVREDNYDLVVVDAPASGHVIGQLAAPDAIRDLVDGGLIRGQTQWMSELLGDPAITGAVVVTAAEEMAVAESVDLVGRIAAETRVDLAAVVVNRVLPELFGPTESACFEWLDGAEQRAALVGVLGDGGDRLDDVLDAARLATAVRRTRSEHLADLRARLPTGTDTLYLPELFLDDHGFEATERMATALGDELGL